MKNDFDAAALDYEEAMQEYERVREDEITWRSTLAACRDRVKEIEAEVMVNGGHEAVVIDGKNAEQRAAQLTLALAKHEGYQGAMTNVRTFEAGVADREHQAATAANRMSLARRRMDFAIAWTQRDAALRRNGAEAVGIK